MEGGATMALGAEQPGLSRRTVIQPASPQIVEVAD